MLNPILANSLSTLGSAGIGKSFALSRRGWQEALGAAAAEDIAPNSSSAFVAAAISAAKEKSSSSSSNAGSIVQDVVIVNFCNLINQVKKRKEKKRTSQTQTCKKHYKNRRASNIKINQQTKTTKTTKTTKAVQQKQATSLRRKIHDLFFVIFDHEFCVSKKQQSNGNVSVTCLNRYTFLAMAVVVANNFSFLTLAEFLTLQK
jgi:hypothetical protein